MAYATGAQMVSRFDARVLGRLVKDDDTLDSNPGASAVLVAMLEDASAEIRSACRANGTYSDTALDDLATANDPMLIRLTCSLAIGLLFARRGSDVPPAVQDEVDQARSTLSALRRGVMVLGGVSSTPAPYQTPASNISGRFPAATSPIYPILTRPL